MSTRRYSDTRRSHLARPDSTTQGHKAPGSPLNRPSAYIDHAETYLQYRDRPLPALPQVSKAYCNRPLPPRPDEYCFSEDRNSLVPMPLKLPKRRPHQDSDALTSLSRKAPTRQPAMHHASYMHPHAGITKFANPISEGRSTKAEPALVPRRSSTANDVAGRTHTSHRRHPPPPVSSPGFWGYQSQYQVTRRSRYDKESRDVAIRRPGEAARRDAATRGCLERHSWGRYEGEWGLLQDEIARLNMNRTTWESAMTAFAGVYSNSITRNTAPEFIASNFAALRRVLVPFWDTNRIEAWLNRLATLATPVTFEVRNTSSGAAPEVQRRRGRSHSLTRAIGSAVHGLVRRLSWPRSQDGSAVSARVTHGRSRARPESSRRR